MALYTALVHYMPLHGLPLDIQPLAIAAAQEQEAPLNDIVDHDGPFEDQDVHAQDDVVDQNAEHGADDEAPAYDAVQAPGPDPAQDADLPALIPGPAEPEVAIANAVLEPAPDVEVMPRTVTRTDAPSVIDTTGTPGREGSTDVRQAHEPVAGASGAPDMPGTWTREGADALLWIYERFSLQGQHRNADAALVQGETMALSVQFVSY
ncbi:hypothetical protein PENSPDRAFT_377894 [Peniophora sp. CONT]|nr:hypothetical protein PENSPDRAFT_377894 [Peniophora sp. CONT]